MTDAGTFIQEGSNLIRTTVNLIFPSFVGGAASWTLKVTPSTITKTKPFLSASRGQKFLLTSVKERRAFTATDVPPMGKRKHSYSLRRFEIPTLPGSENATHRLIEAAVFISGLGEKIAGPAARGISQRLYGT